MPVLEAPNVELGSAPQTPSVIVSPSSSEISSASSPEPQNVRATPLFRMLAMPPPDPEQPPGQDELERRLPGYRRIVIPRELTLIELLKESSGVTTDEEVLTIREAKLRVIAERVGLRRLHVLAPRLRSLTLDGSAISSLRDLGIGLVHLKKLSINRCGLTSLDGIWGLGALKELHAAANRLSELHPLAAMQKIHTLNLADNPIEESSRLWTIGVCSSLRRLTLRGTPIADTMNYRSTVASALPMLVTLDEIPLNADEEDEIPEDNGSAESDIEPDAPQSLPNVIGSTLEPQPSPLNKTHVQFCLVDKWSTAREKFLNKCAFVTVEAELETVGNTMSGACRVLAAEIPRAPNAEQWAKFKEDTGIEIDIDFNARPKEADPTKVLDRLERIEKETMERLNANPNEGFPNVLTSYSLDPSRILSGGIMSDYDLWREIENLNVAPPPDNVDDLFRDLAPIRPRRRRMLEND
ncbi:jg11231 [Pararge aegeria aegeria]|uniref:Jg11231 protein n=1 Tax=Pararge aegeria aegeria TaxID=348720 RepID=A0A8S4RJ08_9NEOP|nr:jg11231 [Pararge aegeria aegeria]